MNVISRPLILAALGTLLTAMNALAQNAAPVASPQTQTTSVGTPKTITLSATDADLDPLTYTVTDPVHGVLSGTPPDLTYTPDAAYNGRDSFTFRAYDGSAYSNTATVKILVNDAPTGAVRINLGRADEEMTRRTSVLLTLTVADDGPRPDPDVHQQQGVVQHLDAVCGAEEMASREWERDKDRVRLVPGQVAAKELARQRHDPPGHGRRR